MVTTITVLEATLDHHFDSNGDDIYFFLEYHVGQIFLSQIGFASLASSFEFDSRILP